MFRENRHVLNQDRRPALGGGHDQLTGTHPEHPALPLSDQHPACSLSSIIVNPWRCLAVSATKSFSMENKGGATR
jgi:hypothetical protein